jgi:hypothetical protein
MVRGGAVYECTFVKVGMLRSPNHPNLASSEVWAVSLAANGPMVEPDNGPLTASVRHHNAFKTRRWYLANLPELHQTGLQAESNLDRSCSPPGDPSEPSSCCRSKYLLGRSSPAPTQKYFLIPQSRGVIHQSAATTVGSMLGSALCR